MQLLLPALLLLSSALAAPSPDKLAVAPPDGYLPAIDDSLGSYEGSGGEEEGGGRAAAGSGEEEEGEVEGSLDGYQGSASGEEEGIQFDLPEYTDDADNLVEAENAAEETTENPTEDITEEPIENNLVEGEEDPAAKNAGETFQAPPPAGPDDIPEGDPANLPDVPPGPKDVAICPGGEVEVCIGVCPGTTARVYGACVQGCADRCAEAERQRRARAFFLQLS